MKRLIAALALVTATGCVPVESTPDADAPARDAQDPWTDCRDHHVCTWVAAPEAEPWRSDAKCWTAQTTSELVGYCDSLDQNSDRCKMRARRCDRWPVDAGDIRYGG